MKGPDVKEDADADPREFLVDVKLDEAREPLALKIRYFACTKEWCRPVTQEYLISWNVNRDAGRVVSRRMDFNSAVPRLGRGGRPGRGGGPLGPGFFGNPEGMIERLLAMDTDGDDRLAPEELPEPMRQRFDRMDENGDGYVEPSEIETMMQRATSRRGRGAWMQRDADGDGKLSIDEVPPRLQERFEQLDTDGDGLLDEQELAAMRGRLGRTRRRRPCCKDDALRRRRRRQNQPRGGAASAQPALRCHRRRRRRLPHSRRDPNRALTKARLLIGPSRGRLRARRLLIMTREERQLESCDAARPIIAVPQRQPAAVVLGDLAGKNESDARSLRLGRKERHKQVRIARESRPFIQHVDAGRLSISAPPDPNAPARLFRGLGGVLNEVDKQLLELRRVRVDHQVGSCFDLKLGGPLDLGDPLDTITKVYRFKAWRGKLGKPGVGAGEAAEGLGARPDGAKSLLHVVSPIRIGCRPAQKRSQTAGDRLDRRQRIVELVAQNADQPLPGL